MPNHKKNILQIVPTSAAHNATRYGERLDGAVSDDRDLEMPDLGLLTLDTAWATIVDWCPPGLLRKSDTGIVLLAARLYQFMENNARLAEMEGRLLYAPDDKQTKTFAMLMAKLGGSPADRGKVTIPKQEKPTSDFD